MGKKFHVMYGIGKCKYVVNHHDGEKTHPDGSAFYDVSIFKNKKKLAAFISGLRRDGYIER